MFVFFHGYTEDTWDGMIKNGLVGKNDGIRFSQSIIIDDKNKFNNLARKGSRLYNIVKEMKCPFYIDRLQGGIYIDDYRYDMALLDEYQKITDGKFYGFQMHEWLSNYHNDVHVKLKELGDDEWTAENIKALVERKYKMPYLFLESMTPEEMAASGKPKNVEEFYQKMTSIFKKRQKLGEIVSCDSEFLPYGFAASAGVRRIMPEVGAQTVDTRIQVCYARGMSKAEGKSFGVYYEPWGGEPFSCCSYNGNLNEWGITGGDDFPFETCGPNGGSSRSLQKRLFLYGYLSGAEFVSEEWGTYNTFVDCDTFELSPYGKVKKDFLGFVEKYDDVGEKLTPLAAVLPSDLMVLDNCHSPNTFCKYEINSPAIANAKRGVEAIFSTPSPMAGSECTSLINSDIPDAIDLLNRDDSLLSDYDYLIDLTGEKDFAQKFDNLCAIEDINTLCKKLLPCYVDGGLHWLVNKCNNGGYYLTVFNHSGVVRNVEKGEYTLAEEEKTVSVIFKTSVSPVLCEGDATLLKDADNYYLTVPAGGFGFIKF